MNIKRLSIILGLCSLLVSPLLLADEPADPEQPEIIKLQITPAAEPRPALKYRLAISARERHPGNGAQFYYRALLTQRGLPEAHHKQFAEKEKDWNESKLDEKRLAEIKAWLASYGGVFRELKVAVYREHCEWDQRMQDLRGLEVVNFVLPEVQEARQLARTLRLKARVEIAEGRYDDAIETLRWGFQLGRDCAEQTSLISDLVGLAICSVMTEPLVELIQAPNSPNMYWAIASLPQPFVDIRQSLDFERGFGEQIFPFLKDAETTQRTPEEWQQLLEKTVASLSQLTSNARPDGDEGWAKLQLFLLGAKLYPAARAELIARGMDPKRVEAMPVGQVVAIHAARQTQETYDEVFKSALLPPPQGLILAQRIAEKLREERLPETIMVAKQLPIAELLMPAIQAVRWAEVRLPRNCAALQAVEAVRMHAAVTGKLPLTLSEISAVPVLPNPVTHEPYSYSLRNGVATLEIQPFAGEPVRGVAKRYVISLAK